MVRKSRLMIAALATLGGVNAARGQWEVVVLHSDEFRGSQVNAAAGSQQAGYVIPTNGLARPVLWEGSPESSVDLRPFPNSGGLILGAAVRTQVGHVYFFAGDNPHAALWEGSADTFVDLTPGGQYPFAYGTATSDTEQVGYAGFIPTTSYHACSWHGSAASFVDLHPPRAVWSQAFATDGEQQGGWGSIGGELHGLMWFGSAASVVDVHPLGAQESVINAIAGGVQVGSVEFAGHQHAVIWRGTAESMVDLHPQTAISSIAFSTTGTIHAGYANFTGWAHAGIWVSNDPASFEDLHFHLGPEWYTSVARAVTQQHGWLHVSGFGKRTGSGLERAILWKGPMVQPKDAHRRPSALSLP